MLDIIDLGDFTAEVEFKDVKYIYLSVYPPSGHVRIAAPYHMKLDIIRVYAITRLDWIKRERAKFKDQQREAPREMLELESHYLWGRRYLLHKQEHDKGPRVEVSGKRMILLSKPDATLKQQQEALASFYRTQLRLVAPQLIEKWSQILLVELNRFYVQHMKTRWGSCNPKARTIRLNTELAKKPLECLEYIIVHELVHLVEPTHNDRFVQLMNNSMPHWRHLRQRLNDLPVKHEGWEY